MSEPDTDPFEAPEPPKPKKSAGEHASHLTAWAGILATLVGVFQTVWTEKPWWVDDKAVEEPAAIEVPLEDEDEWAPPDDFELPPAEDFPEITRIQIKGGERYEWPEGWDRDRVWHEIIVQQPAAADGDTWGTAGYDWTQEPTTAPEPPAESSGEEPLSLPVGLITMIGGIPVTICAFLLASYLRRRREQRHERGEAC